MKHLLYGFAIIALLQVVSCGGGSGAGGAEPLPQDDGTATQTVNDTPATPPDTNIVVPTVDPNQFTTDTTTTTETTTETTTTTTPDTTVADNTGTDKGNDKGTGKSGNDTTIPGNNDSGTGPDNKDTGNTAAGNNGNGNNAGGNTDTGTTTTVTDNTSGTTTGTSGTTTTASNDTTDTTVVPDDEISADEDDVEAGVTDESDMFNYATSITLPAKLTFKDKESGAAISGIEIIVYNPSDESVLARAFSDSKGVAEFDITGIDTGSRIELVFKKDGYTPITGYFIEKNDIATIAELVRTLELAKIAGKTTVSDQDKDGVSDQNDEFPTDKSVAKLEKHSYLLAFEDRYPGLGDADFNDAVIRYDIDEYISADNTVPRIVIRTQVLAAGTNKEAVLAVNIAGKEYVLVSNVKKELTGWNTRLSDKYLPGKVGETTIEFSKPLDRKSVGAVPFDPFLIPNGAHAKKHKSSFRNEIHLSWVKTPYKRMRLSRQGMTWALLLPSNWVWPAEKTGGIFRAYPQFASWYKSAGKTNVDWYNNYESGLVFAQAASASSIAGYLFNNKLLGTTVLLMLIAAAGSAIAVMRYFRLKRD